MRRLCGYLANRCVAAKNQVCSQRFPSAIMLRFPSLVDELSQIAIMRASRSTGNGGRWGMILIIIFEDGVTEAVSM